jgi:hypothetical protein
MRNHSQPERSYQTYQITRHWQLTPVIPAIQEAEIRRLTVQSQLRQIVCETLS